LLHDELLLWKAIDMHDAHRVKRAPVYSTTKQLGRGSMSGVCVLTTTGSDMVARKGRVEFEAVR